MGAAIGALLGLAWWGSGKAWPAGVAAAIVVAADLALTGMLHLDGLLDSADGLLPHLARERRLEVMRDHSVGAFGMAAGGAVLLLRWSALSATRPSVLLLVGIWAISRAAMAVAARVMPYARQGRGGGIATAFLADQSATASAATAGVIGLVTGLACLIAWRPAAGAAVLGAELVAALAVLVVRRAAHRRLHRRRPGSHGDHL